MRLSRITQHVKDQNWFAVALDFVIVVVGILIAFQITNWNEVRGDRLDEQRYLAELAKDLRTALQEIDETIGNAQLRHDAGAFVLGDAEQLATTATFKKMGVYFTLKGLQEAEPENHLPLIFSVARIVDRHGDTYAELIATGKISVFEDRSLVRALSSYYSTYDEIQTGDQMNWTQMFSTRNLLQSKGISMAAPVSAEDFISLMNEDDELEAAVRNVSDLADWQIVRLSNLRTKTDAVLTLVQGGQK